MSSKIDISDIHSIQSFVKSGRVKDALETAQRCAAICGLWQQGDMLSAHERTYRAMTEYLDTESDSLHRSRSLAVIKEDLLRLADILRLEMDIQTPRSGRESDIYTSAVRTRRLKQAGRMPVPRLYPLLTLIKGVKNYDEKYDLLNELFKFILTTQHLSREEVSELTELFSSEETDEEVLAMVIAALGLANLYYYDYEKLRLLLSFSTLHSAQLQARALTGVYLTLWRHQQRISLDPDMINRLETLSDNAETMRVMRKVALAFLASRDTQRINQKMQEDIIPELQRLHSDFVKRFPTQVEMSEMLDPERNPEWEEMLSGSSLASSLQELGEMQAQGGDVMMLAFSNLKKFTFFQSPGNWLLPYSSSHPTLRQVQKQNADLLEVIDSAADFLCDSDKYSLALAFAKMPAAAGGVMLENMRKQFEQYREEKATSLRKQTEPAVDIYVLLYVRSLSRLLQQFPHPGLYLPNPFLRAIVPSTLPGIGKKMATEKDLKMVSEFLFVRGYYHEALPVLKALKQMTGSSASLCEKIGYAMQQTGDTVGALESYHQAEMLTKAPGQWLLRKLATLSRASGDHRNALIYWQQLSELRPDDTKIAMQYANTLFDTGNIKEALTKYYKVDYLRGTSERTWRPIAWCEFVLSNYNKAQEYYDRLLTKADNASDMLNAGHLALASGRMNDAVNLYVRAAGCHEAGMNGLLEQLRNDAEILSRYCKLNTEEQSMLLDRVAFSFAEK